MANNDNNPSNIPDRDVKAEITNNFLQHHAEKTTEEWQQYVATLEAKYEELGKPEKKKPWDFILRGIMSVWNVVKIAVSSVFLGRKETSRRIDEGNKAVQQKENENATKVNTEKEKLRTEIEVINAYLKTQKEERENSSVPDIAAPEKYLAAQKLLEVQNKDMTQHFQKGLQNALVNSLNMTEYKVSVKNGKDGIAIKIHNPQEVAHRAIFVKLGPDGKCSFDNTQGFYKGKDVTFKKLTNPEKAVLGEMRRCIMAFVYKGYNASKDPELNEKNGKVSISTESIRVEKGEKFLTDKDLQTIITGVLSKNPALNGHHISYSCYDTRLEFTPAVNKFSKLPELIIRAPFEKKQWVLPIKEITATEKSDIYNKTVQEITNTVNNRLQNIYNQSLMPRDDNTKNPSNLYKSLTEVTNTVLRKDAIVNLFARFMREAEMEKLTVYNRFAMQIGDTHFEFSKVDKNDNPLKAWYFACDKEDKSVNIKWNDELRKVSDAVDKCASESERLAIYKDYFSRMIDAYNNDPYLKETRLVTREDEMVANQQKLMDTLQQSLSSKEFLEGHPIHIADGLTDRDFISCMRVDDQQTLVSIRNKNYLIPTEDFASPYRHEGLINVIDIASCCANFCGMSFNAEVSDVEREEYIKIVEHLDNHFLSADEIFTEQQTIYEDELIAWGMSQPDNERGEEEPEIE